MCDFYSELPGLKNDRIQGKEKVKPGKERASKSCFGHLVKCIDCFKIYFNVNIKA